MSLDIYKKYIESNLKEKKLEKNESVSINEEFSNTDTLHILKEINQKLNNLSNNDNTKVFKTFDSEEYDIIIKNGNVVIAGDGVINTDISIKDGKIVSLTKNERNNAKEIIDAKGKHVIPGIIDPHVHLGLFAPFEKELETETKSALIGGVTTVGCYLGSESSHFDTFPQVFEKINEKSYVDVLPHLVINSQIQMKEIRDYANHLGVTSFKLYMNGIPGLIPDVDDGFILDVFDEIKKVDKECIVCVHSENRYLVRRATEKIRELKGDKANIVDWSDTHPDIAEEEAVIRLSYLAEKSRVPVYFVHISSAKAINKLRKIKPFNKNINIETTSPYLSLTKYSVSDNSIKMEPPFRDSEDVEELWKAVEDDIVDTIGTDNVTMSKKEKNSDASIWDTIPGYPALETHLPILLFEGVVKRGIGIEKVIEKITKKPAKTFGIYPKKGSLLPGSDADIVIVDMNEIKEVVSSNLSSRSDFSIYNGKKIQGWPVITIKSGKIIVQNGRFIDHNIRGECIKR